MSASPMRLLHLIDLRNVGGVERIFADFVAQPSPYPVQHLTLADHSDIAPLLAEAVLAHTEFASMRHFAGMPLPRRPRFLRQKNRLRLIHALRPDRIIVWNQIIDFYDVPASRRVFPCPALYYEHGAAWYRYHEARVRGFFAQIDGVTAVSNAARRMLEIKHQVAQPVQVRYTPMRPGVVPASVLPLLLPRRAPAISASRPLHLGCAGRLVSVKCMGLLVLAVKTLRDRGIPTVATIAGEGGERARIEALIAKHGLQDCVKLLGLSSDMAAFYQGIDIYLGTSMHESFGLTLLEASAWGVPVITSNMDGMPEAVRDGETGLETGQCLTPALERENYLAQTGASSDVTEAVYWPVSDTVAPPKMLAPEAIADAIVALLNDPQRYQRMSAQAIAHTKAQRDFATLCEELYQDIAALAFYRHKT